MWTALQLLQSAPCCLEWQTLGFPIILIHDFKNHEITSCWRFLDKQNSWSLMSQQAGLGFHSPQAAGTPVCPSETAHLEPERTAPHYTTRRRKYFQNTQLFLKQIFPQGLWCLGQASVWQAKMSLGTTRWQAPCHDRYTERDVTWGYLQGRPGPCQEVVFTAWWVLWWKCVWGHDGGTGVGAGCGLSGISCLWGWRAGSFGCVFNIFFL